MNIGSEQVNRRILVVADDPGIHEAYREVLVGQVPNEGVSDDLRSASPGAPTKNTGVIQYHVERADQGQEGLEKVREALARNRRFAMAFVDTRMPPGRDGIETINRLWEADADLQLVLCTAHSDYSWDEKVEGLGHPDQLLLLKKPFDRAQVWQLAYALTSKWELGQRARRRLQELEDLFAERTAELSATNARLIKEVSERQQVDEDLARAQALLLAAIEQTPAGIIIADAPDGRIRIANSAARGIHGGASRPLTEISVSMQSPGCQASAPDGTPIPSEELQLTQVITQGRTFKDVDVLIGRDDGERRRVSVNAAPVRNGEGDIIAGVVVFQDVTELRQTEDRLLHAATHDMLTGLPNRAYLLDRVDKRLRQAKRRTDYSFALLFLDLDNFKVINDSLGHRCGDELLVQVAAKLKECLRELDTVVRLNHDTTARLGGDEFVILLDGVARPSDVAAVAERLLESLRQPIQLGASEVVISASVGITMGSANYEDAHGLLRDADTAMYRAKNAGKAQYAVFDREMHVTATARLQLENDLRRALEQNEFCLVYQPIVNISTLRIVAFEALVRWSHPARGLIPPEQFIAVTEETGLIVPLGQWVLREACRQLKEWCTERRGSPAPRMNVNLSRRQLLDPNTARSVSAVLKSTGIGGEQLNLEITEGTIVTDFELAGERLQDLKKLGVGLHMDDFGKGYSSLSCLHRFPLDVVKIDHSFVTTTEANRNYAAVIRAVVSMAHSLNMQVIVEGVETPHQLAEIESLGCDWGQGYVFSKPVDAEKASAMLRCVPGSEPWVEHLRKVMVPTTSPRT